MKVDILVLGKLNTNCYILEKNNKVLIIDPADNYEIIANKIGDKKISGVLVTHYHFDHVGALKELEEKDKVKVYDINNLQEGNKIVDDFKFEVIYTKGHTSDSVSYYFYEDNIIFCGDFIFYENIGRCDLPTGSEKEMKKSIMKIKKYDKNMIIYPGHGKMTTLGYEWENNIYFKEKS